MEVISPPLTKMQAIGIEQNYIMRCNTLKNGIKEYNQRNEVSFKRPDWDQIYLMSELFIDEHEIIVEGCDF